MRSCVFNWNVDPSTSVHVTVDIIIIIDIDVNININIMSLHEWRNTAFAWQPIPTRHIHIDIHIQQAGARWQGIQVVCEGSSSLALGEGVSKSTAENLWEHRAKCVATRTRGVELELELDLEGLGECQDWHADSTMHADAQEALYEENEVKEGKEGKGRKKRKD
jgi:hypothetical protein